MRKYLFAVLFGLFTCPLFATGIDSGATSADCDNATLGQYKHLVNITAQQIWKWIGNQTQ